MQIQDGRAGLLHTLNDKKIDPWTVRDLLFLDFALEQQQCILLQVGRCKRGAS